MARNLSRRRPNPMAPAVAEYFADLQAQIPGWRLARRPVLAELVDGLNDAIAHYVARGLDADAAAARAVQDSGPASVVAADIADLLATGQARHTALALLLTGPPIGALWLLTLVPGQGPDALLLRIPGLGLLALFAVIAGLLTLIAPGPGSQKLSHLRLGPRRAAAAACAAAAVCDIVILAAATLQALEQPAATRWVPALSAVTASLVRLTLTQRVARRDLPLLPDDA